MSGASTDAEPLLGSVQRSEAKLCDWVVSQLAEETGGQAGAAVDTDQNVGGNMDQLWGQRPPGAPPG